MTPFYFMQAAFFILVGVALLGLAVLIIYGVIAGIRNHMHQKRRERDLYLGRGYGHGK